MAEVEARSESHAEAWARNASDGEDEVDEVDEEEYGELEAAYGGGTFSLGMRGGGGGGGGGGKGGGSASSAMGMRHSVAQGLKRSGQNGGVKRSLYNGRDERATTEQVMDPKTRMVLFKMLSRGFLSEINGCLSTGKEANVYYAKQPSGAELAIKVYKTSILVFKDRDRYVSGEWRFRNGYCRSNPRKMVSVWAEKEMRNLKRLHEAGVPCPEPLLVKRNVLVMKFLGAEGWPAPRLKDAGLSSRRLQQCYWQVVRNMRVMFHKCRLVHGDLSEYNMLYHGGNVIFIDVSQSVEHDHPHSFNFLRMDCQNVNDFFRREGLEPMSTRELFDFIVDDTIAAGEEDARLEEIMRAEAGAAFDAVDEAVFMNTHIPRSLFELENHEREARLVESGGREQAFVDAVRRMTGAGGAGGAGSGDDEDGEDGEDGGGSGAGGEGGDDEASAGSGEASSSEEEGRADKRDLHSRRLPSDPEERKAARAAKKEARRAVKEAQREKRKTKIKKHVKKQKVKATKKK